MKHEQNMQRDREHASPTSLGNAAAQQEPAAAGREVAGAGTLELKTGEINLPKPSPTPPSGSRAMRSETAVETLRFDACTRHAVGK